jgi:hypothetical protein
MLVEAAELHPEGYALAVYDPPADGLPWLVVCLGPEGRLVAAVTSHIADAARARIADFKAELRLKPPTKDRPVH